MRTSAAMLVLAEGWLMRESYATGKPVASICPPNGEPCASTAARLWLCRRHHLGRTTLDDPLVDVGLVLFAVDQRNAHEQRHERQRRDEHQGVERLVPQHVHEEEDDQCGLDRGNG